MAGRLVGGRKRIDIYIYTRTKCQQRQIAQWDFRRFAANKEKNTKEAAFSPIVWLTCVV